MIKKSHNDNQILLESLEQKTCMINEFEEKVREL